MIAISGLRLADRELLELGLSFPGVANRARQIENLPSLGLLTLAGLLPGDGDIEVTYLEASGLDQPDVVAEQAGEMAGRFDAAALSCLTATAGDAFRLGDALRAVGLPVILGGLYPTLNPGRCLAHADAVVAGEGEPVWLQVVDDLRRGRLQPLYDARNKAPFSMDQSPAPRFDLLAPDRYPRFTVQTQRGCPYACDFCAASMRLAPGYRTKPAELIARDIDLLRQRFDRPFIELADDNTFADKRHGRAVARIMRERGLSWFTETDISLADDPELVDELAESGCRQVLIGLESPGPDALDGIELKANWKARRAPDYAAAVDRIQSRGVAVNGCFVVGLDRHGPEVFDAIVDFATRTALHDVQVTVVTPFPGTPLHQRLQQGGRLLHDPAGHEQRCTLFDLTFQPSRMDPDQLRDGFLDLVRAVYDPVRVRSRRRHFHRQRRGVLRAEAAQP